MQKSSMTDHMQSQKKKRKKGGGLFFTLSCMLNGSNSDAVK